MYKQITYMSSGNNPIIWKQINEEDFWAAFETPWAALTPIRKPELDSYSLDEVLNRVKDIASR